MTLEGILEAALCCVCAVGFVPLKQKWIPLIVVAWKHKCHAGIIEINNLKTETGSRNLWIHMVLWLCDHEESNAAYRAEPSFHWKAMEKHFYCTFSTSKGLHGPAWTEQSHCRQYPTPSQHKSSAQVHFQGSCIIPSIFFLFFSMPPLFPNHHPSCKTHLSRVHED